MNTCNFFEWKSTLNLDYLTKYTRFLSLQDTITLLYKCRFTTNALFKLVQKADNKQPFMLNMVKAKGFLD